MGSTFALFTVPVFLGPPHTPPLLCCRRRSLRYPSARPFPFSSLPIQCSFCDRFLCVSRASCGHSCRVGLRETSSPSFPASEKVSFSLRFPKDSFAGSRTLGWSWFSFGIGCVAPFPLAAAASDEKSSSFELLLPVQGRGCCSLPAFSVFGLRKLAHDVSWHGFLLVCVGWFLLLCLQVHSFFPPCSPFCF